MKAIPSLVLSYTRKATVFKHCTVIYDNSKNLKKNENTKD